MIEFKNVFKQYDHGVTALNDVNIKIDKGEFVFFVGPSGSGKSTLLKLLIKEEDATKGTVTVSDTNITELKDKNIPQLRRKIGFVFQDFRLIYDRTVYDNIAFALYVVEEDAKNIPTKVKQVLDLVGLGSKSYSYPNQLSGGEQQRVALARAIVTAPPIVIADEPTGNLDTDTADDIMKRLYELNKYGTTVIVVSHDKEMIEKSGKRKIYMEKGKVMSDSGKSELKPIVEEHVVEVEKSEVKVENANEQTGFFNRNSSNMGGGF